ncbi:hypothetical protein [Actinomadura sp. 9N407]|uniref:hypothetical protein n=1 Tax=Actinomadura sp. 9N407 TaxID=3375154 RepID=UPI0037A82C1D
MWIVDVQADPVKDPTEERILAAVQEAVHTGRGEIWIRQWADQEHGPALAMVIGGARAFVAAFSGIDEVGHHAIDPAAPSAPSERYALANGQVDAYDDRDTVSIHYIPQIVTHFLATHGRWNGVQWYHDGATPLD